MIWLFPVLAYFIGSISFAYWSGKLVKGVDIRHEGSGNLGATNVFRVVGKFWGVLVFVFDALKGALAVLLSGWVLGSALPFWLPMLCGVIVILGHTFSVWFHFKGGKGVATSLGVFLALAPVPALATFGCWIVVFLISHTISIASLAAALIFPIMVTLLARGSQEFPFLLAISLLLTVFIFYTHRKNVQRLLRREETKLF